MVDHDEYPFAKVNADGWEVYGKGKLKYVRFGGADMYARKSMADPDMVSHSFVHHFEAPGNSVLSISSMDANCRDLSGQRSRLMLRMTLGK